MNCSEFLKILPRYLEEEIDGIERRSWREHLNQCSSCREVAFGEDPSLILSAGLSKTVDQEGVDTCIANLSSMIRQEKLQRRLGHSSKWWYAAAAAVFLMISANFLPRFSPEAGLGQSAEAIPTVVASDHHEVQPPRMDIDMVRDGLRIYQFADSSDENAVAYFIVDESLEL